MYIDFLSRLYYNIYLVSEQFQGGDLSAIYFGEFSLLKTCIAGGQKFQNLLWAVTLAQKLDLDFPFPDYNVSLSRVNQATSGAVMIDSRWFWWCGFRVCKLGAFDSAELLMGFIKVKNTKLTSYKTITLRFSQMGKGIMGFAALNKFLGKTKLQK